MKVDSQEKNVPQFKGAEATQMYTFVKPPSNLLKICIKLYMFPLKMNINQILITLTNISSTHI